MILKDFRERFADDLRDPEFQREFIAAAYEEEGADGVIRALGEIASATRRVSKIAEAAGVARTSLYRSLTEGGNPSFKTVQAALQTLGLDFAIVSAPSTSKTPSPKA